MADVRVGRLKASRGSGSGEASAIAEFQPREAREEWAGESTVLAPRETSLLDCAVILADRHPLPRRENLKRLLSWVDIRIAGPATELRCSPPRPQFIRRFDQSRTRIPQPEINRTLERPGLVDVFRGRWFASSNSQIRTSRSFDSTSEGWAWYGQVAVRRAPLLGSASQGDPGEVNFRPSRPQAMAYMNQRSGSDKSGSAATRDQSCSDRHHDVLDSEFRKVHPFDPLKEAHEPVQVSVQTVGEQ